MYIIISFNKYNFNAFERDYAVLVILQAIVICTIKSVKMWQNVSKITNTNIEHALIR